MDDRQAYFGNFGMETEAAQPAQDKGDKSLIETVPWILSGVSIVGALFNAYGKRAGFWIWIVGDIAWIIYCLASKFYAQIPLWAVFLAVCVLGLIKWKKKGIG